MKAQQLRTLILQNADPVALQSALDKLRDGKDLTALDSGTVAYGNIQNVPLASDAAPQVFFDGFTFTVFLFVASGAG